MSARRRPSLRQRIFRWLMLYTLLVFAAVFAHGYFVNEKAEQLVWESLLSTELDYFLQRRAGDAHHLWADTEDLRLYTSDRLVATPASVAALPPGLHDDVIVAGRENVVLVKDVAGERYRLALDITRLEAEEETLALTMMVSGALLVSFAGIMLAFGLGRITRPLAKLADRIGQLQPDRGDAPLAVEERASAELVIITEALNDYVARYERFVERERRFIDTSSHELRTPIAVVTGAAELALEQPDLPDLARSQLLRIQRTARLMEQLVTLFLVLAKDPERFSAAGERFDLGELLAGIVDDHDHLTREKDLVITLEKLPACEVVAPALVVQTAIANLLRNAIEGSDRGEIRIGLEADATVVIDDPGHGMTPEEISALYARAVRGSARGDGIGLALIARICEHLGWELSFAPGLQGGTRTRLRLSGTTAKLTG